MFAPSSRLEIAEVSSKLALRAARPSVFSFKDSLSQGKSTAKPLARLERRESGFRNRYKELPSTLGDYFKSNESHAKDKVNVFMDSITSQLPQERTLERPKSSQRYPKGHKVDNGIQVSLASDLAEDASLSLGE